MDAVELAWQEVSGGAGGGPCEGAAADVQQQGGWVMLACEGMRALSLVLGACQAAERYVSGARNGYAIDPITGKPGEGRPALQQRWRLVAKNPRLAMCFFHSYVEAFQEVYLGWPPGAKRQ
eukprot:gene1343-1686_t